MKTQTGLTIKYRKNGNIKSIKSEYSKDFKPYKSLKKILKEEELHNLYAEHNKQILTQDY